MTQTHSTAAVATAKPETRWTRADVLALLEQPFNDLVFHAQQVHRASFEPNTVQLSTLLSIKTGGCPEDCALLPTKRPA